MIDKHATVKHWADVASYVAVGLASYTQLAQAVTPIVTLLAALVGLVWWIIRVLDRIRYGPAQQRRPKSDKADGGQP